MNEDYLLNSDISRRIFHENIEKLPIIDFHNHLQTDDLLNEKKFANITELWIQCDPYKHRAMRICGVDEKYITGNAKDEEKFKAWMSVLERLPGNPLYDWSILEMNRVFQIDLQPGVTDAGWLWKKTEELLALPEYSAAGIFRSFNVEYAAPCMAVTDEVDRLTKIKNLAPSLRADSILECSRAALDGLERLTGEKIDSLKDYCTAISKRLDAFEAAGCRFSDHALDNGFYYFEDDGKNKERFMALKRGEDLEREGRGRLASFLLKFLSEEYAGRGWTMQLHIGAQRYTSTRLRRIAGAAGGFAAIGNCCHVESLTRMLDDFEKGAHGLPSVILFTLNPADNAVMSVLSGSYTQAGFAGKVQQGTAWWWCDHLYGMREVFETISSFGVLSAFLGMTTDSRSLLSFVRHEYFRRALCGWLGDKASRGELLASEDQLKRIAQDICYYNLSRAIKKE